MDYDKLMERANVHYVGRKYEKGLVDPYTAPECMPRIQSDQIYALAKALCELMAEGQTESTGKAAVMR